MTYGAALGGSSDILEPLGWLYLYLTGLDIELSRQERVVVMDLMARRRSLPCEITECHRLS